MMDRSLRIKYFLYKHTGMFLLFFSILNSFDLNDLGYKYFSFSFSYILIFYFNLKRKEGLGYIPIFIAGLFNDVIIGTPMGISSLIYLMICGAAAYLRNITLRPHLVKDWIFFLVTLLILNSISFFILNFIFSYEVSTYEQLADIFFTWLFYLIFSYIFDFYGRLILGRQYVK